MPGEPAAALGPGSVHHEVMVAIGGVSALEAGRPYMPLDAEDLLTLSPEAIVLLAPGKDGDWRALLGSLAELPVPAIENGRVAVFRDDEVLMASTSTLRYAQELRRQLGEWARER
jgi:ABC-type hemin transport system substrate-binding protein